MSAVSAAECGGSTGRPMTDDRPAPQYGEYASPEQQAAAMGRAYVPPPPPEAAPHPAAPPPPGAPAEQLRGDGSFVDRFVTVFQLGVGLVTLIGSDWFQFSEQGNIGLAEMGSSTRLPAVLDQYGWILLAINIVCLLATIVWAYATLRRGKRAFYIPFVGLFAFTIVASVVVAAIVR
jgi:Family of unknown function (DUF6264)